MRTKKLLVPFCLLLCLMTLHTALRAQEQRIENSVVQRARQYELYLQTAAIKYDVDAQLLWVIAYLETRFNPHAISRKGARGLMQFMPATAARWGLRNAHDPVAAIDAAARYVLYLQTNFGTRPELILAAYNAGETTVAAYLTGRSIRIGDKIINPAKRNTGGIPPYRETQNYVATGMQLLGAKFYFISTTSVSSLRKQKPTVLHKTTKPLVPSLSQRPSKSISFLDISSLKTTAPTAVQRSISFR